MPICVRQHTFLFRSAQNRLDLERGLRFVGCRPSGNAWLDDDQPEYSFPSASTDKLFGGQGEKVVIVHLDSLRGQDRYRATEYK